MHFGKGGFFENGSFEPDLVCSLSPEHQITGLTIFAISYPVNVDMSFGRYLRRRRGRLSSNEPEEFNLKLLKILIVITWWHILST